MFCTLKNRTEALTIRTHILATLASFAAFQGTRIQLDRLYSDSGHPVDYATGQLFAGGSFDALENLMSFWMMQFDTAIPQTLALIYSSFAALKFASLTAAMALAFFALIAAGFSGGLRLLRRSNQAA